MVIAKHWFCVLCIRTSISIIDHSIFISIYFQSEILKKCIKSMSFVVNSVENLTVDFYFLF